MSVLRQNIIANYAGQLWIAVMGLAFIPLYIRLLGLEAFGLVGFMLGMQALTLLFDLGLGGAMNRELARRAATGGIPAGNLVRTLECIIWPAALAFAVLFWAASSWLAGSWLHLQQLQPERAASVLAIMGLAVALQLPCSIYNNGLAGLERQTRLNVVNAVFATLRYAGVLPLLYWVSPTLEVYAWWSVLVGLLQALTLAFVLWRLLPAGAASTARFSRGELRDTARFAGGLMTIMVFAVTVSQIDRIVLSYMRPLSDLGYFTLAMSVAAGLGRMVQPMFNALYPRFSRLVSAAAWLELSQLYHLGSQLLSVVVASVSVMLMFFARDVIYLWSGDAATADTVALPLIILVAGSACNGLMNTPYALQLAHGWTRLAAVSNFVALVVGIPFCIWAVDGYGIVGASLLWFCINCGNLIIGIPLMHRRLMRHEMQRWYLHDLLPPILASVLVVGTARLLLLDIERNFQGLLWLALVGGIALLAAALAAPLVREILVLQWKALRHPGDGEEK